MMMMAASTEGSHVRYASWEKSEVWDRGGCL